MFTIKPINYLFFIIVLMICSFSVSKSYGYTIESQRRIGIYTTNLKDKDIRPLNARYRDIVVDGLNIEENGNISMNVYNTGYAAAALKVLDKNGNIVSILKIDGSEQADTVIGDIILKTKNSITQITDYKNRGWSDVRNPAGGANMTVIHNLQIPQEGRIEICKKCNEALILNYFDELLKRAISSFSKKSSEVFISELKDSGLYEKLALNLMIKVSEKTIKFNSNLLLDAAYKGNYSDITNISVEDMTKSLISEIILPSLEEILTDEKIISLMIDSGAKGLVSEILEKITAGATSTNVLLAKEIAEKLASYLNSFNVILDQNRALKSNRKPVYLNYSDYMDARAKLGLDNFKIINLKNLDDMVCITQGQTSLFGSSDYFMNDETRRAMEFAEKINRSIQENPYYEAGTALIQAPVDVVLAWGAHPADLDSHMTGPINATSSERFHTSFEHPGNLDNDPHVLLYRDYTDHHPGGANRPEQTRINVTQPGVYNFYVHDYSNQGAEHSTALSNSGAVVSLHSAGSRTLPEGDNLGKKVVEYKVPTNREGTVWHTFELDTRRNTIKEINKFNNASNPEKVPFDN